MIRRTLAPAATLVAVLAAVALAVLVTRGAVTAVPPSGDPPPGAAISADDRQAVAARPVDRGAPAPPVDPAVDLADPAQVARAYLVAAHSLTADEAGRTHLAAAGYAAPGSPAATVGVLVLDPPPAGSRRTASVTGLAPVAASDDSTRQGYRAEIGTATGPPGGPLTVALLVRHVVLAHQPDGTWLVTAESTATPDLSAGEH